jgi:hypothetical protein
VASNTSNKPLVPKVKAKPGVSWSSFYNILSIYLQHLTISMPLFRWLLAKRLLRLILQSRVFKETQGDPHHWLIWW